MNPGWRITVVGAGPAGSMAALLLARGGFSVTLIEQHGFPRDKVCGECLSALGMDVLTRAGLADPVIAAGAIKLERAMLHGVSGEPATVSLPRPMWGLSRARLDSLLLDAAVSAGIRLLQPVRCESLVVKERPILGLRHLMSNRVEAIVSDMIVVADGKSGWCGAAPAPAPATGDFGIKAHFRDVAGPRDSIELFCTNGTYGGLAAIEGDRWNAAWSVPAHLLRAHAGDMASLFSRLVRSNQALGQRLRRAERVGPWLASPLSRYPVRQNWPTGVVPVGNAAAAVEPIGGEGMGLALRSAELVAEAMNAGLAPDIEAMGRAYGALWTARRLGCRLAAKVAAQPIAANLATDALRRCPELGPLALSLMGKGDVTRGWRLLLAGTSSQCGSR